MNSRTRYNLCHSGKCATRKHLYRTTDDLNDLYPPSSPRSHIFWHTDDEGLSPRTSKYYSDLFGLYAQDNTMGRNTKDDTSKTRTKSTMTTFPGFVSSETKPTRSDNLPPNPQCHQFTSTEPQILFKKYYRRAREIYQNGPPGEAEIVFVGIRNHLQGRDRGTVLEVHSPKRAGKTVKASEDSGKVYVRAESTNKPPVRQTSSMSYGGISSTSREVPIKLHRSVLNADINKPLPPYPPLSPVPKQQPRKDKGKAVNLNKPLPITPLPCSSADSKPTSQLDEESPVDTPWPLASMQPVSHNAASTQKVAKKGSKPAIQWPQQSTQSRPPLNKLPIAHSQSYSKYKSSKAEKAHKELKAKISRPIAFPPAMNDSQTPFPPHPAMLSEKAKGKQAVPPSPTWLDKLTHPMMPGMTMTHKIKKRPDSEESFVCQGIRTQDDIDVGTGGKTMDMGAGRMNMGAGRGGAESMRPTALFTGTVDERNSADGRGVDLQIGRWI